ncbi:MAG: hypothetical protein WC496_09495 [Phycisphaerae bacterium]|jgi:pectate lyase
MKKKLWLTGLVLVSLFCFVSSAFAADGWASVSDTSGTPYNLTGGAAGSTVTVTTAASFNSYAISSTPYVIQISGTIDLSSISNHTVYVKSNKTIVGIGTSPTIYGHLDIKNGVSNIIISRLNINYNANEGSEDPWTDGITIQDASHHIWINHCNIYNSPDGLIDIGNASDFVTVSWCKFYYETGIYNTDHHFTNLIGSSDTEYGDRGKLHITFHHNWWAERCRGRMPRVRFGQVHIYNNYYGCTGNDYCIHPGKEAQLRIESNYFYQVDEPIDEPNASALVYSMGNFTSGCTGIHYIPNSEVFTPPYSYNLNPGNLIKNIVMAGAGADGIEPDITPPAVPTGLTAEANETKVILDWDDNTESDLAGYNIYHSLTPGTGYSKLNGTTLLTDSNFVDIYIIYGRKFYYVVTAVDTSSNASVYSNEVSAIPRIYGDFVIDQTVNTKDIGYFSDLWLVNDCDATADMDIDDDCTVNFLEFAAMAENWLMQYNP